MMAIALARCATTAPQAGSFTSRPEDRFLVDPRTGYGKAAARRVDHRFNDAWEAFREGDFEAARRGFASLQERQAYPPAYLGEAAIHLHRGSLAQADLLIERTRLLAGNYTAVMVYGAELELSRDQTRRAFDLYRQIAAAPDAPAASRQRFAALQTRLFDELYAQALGAPNSQATVILREALTINPAAHAARLLLVQKEITLRKFDDAQRDLDPMLSGPDADRPEIQEAVAEIDAGRGRFHEAIVRYEALERRKPDGRYAKRLEQLKEEWNAANMPAVYQNAVDSPAITRGDLAVLMYWQVASIRFAQDLAAPPIALDIDVPGREEIIRALALGIYQVDPVTRRVDPNRLVTESALSRAMARILLVRGSACARKAGSDPTEAARAQKILDACGVQAPSLEATVSGRDAQALLETVDRILSSAEQ